MSRFIENLKLEMSKVVWPNFETVTRQTMVVLLFTFLLTSTVYLFDIFSIKLSMFMK